MIFKNSVLTAKKTPHFTITKINWLTLFKEIIAVYTENHTKHKKCRLIDLKQRDMQLPFGLKGFKQDKNARHVCPRHRCILVC
jgi:hypothetical protein